MNQKELIGYLVQKNMLSSSSVEVRSLSGGVSSEILLIEEGNKKFVLKRALTKLKVKDEWFADVKRNHIEQKYIKYVTDFLPQAVPQILYNDEKHHFFCMEMLENGLTNWKELLLNKKLSSKYATEAGKIMGVIHNRSAEDSNLKQEFDTLQNFQELRIEPYLTKTGKRHPDLSSYFNDEAKRLASVKQCLVHGDFSPKNILVSPERFVLLDCEVAWYGDPIFDVGFLLNHFILKALYIPSKAKEFADLAKTALNSYKEHSGGIFDEAFDAKLTRLILLLMMARVDGKSPVEYLNHRQQQKVRNFVYQELDNNINNFSALIMKWLENIQF